ncbi:hypothetical protein SAMN06309944_0677 [Micrococcales bacterium KH10]|nr:hypothetical protein SAMN06309944_0677 [Micrococcales bacterium KH10]
MGRLATKFTIAVTAITLMLSAVAIATPAAAATGKITGTVNWTGPAPGTTYVELQEWDPIYGFWNYAGAYEQMTPSGGFTLEDIPAGEYSLVVYSESYADTWLGNRTFYPERKAAVTSFTVANGQTVTGKNIALTEYMPQVTINLSNFGSNASVQLRATNLNKGSQSSASVTSSATGSATTTMRLRPGRNWVTAHIPPSPNNGGTLRPYAENINVQVSGTAPITLNLSASAVRQEITGPWTEIRGANKVGSVVEAWPDYNAPGLSPSLSYFWSDGTQLIGTAKKLTIPASVLAFGYPMVTVIARASGQVTGIYQSNRWDFVAETLHGDVLSPTTVPTVAGQTRVGGTLRAAVGSWTPTPTSYRYQWLRAGAPIAGATNATYKLRPADAGKRIALRVTGVRAGHGTRAITTAATAKVAKAKAKVVIKPVKRVVKRGKRAAIKVRVNAKGATPTGRIKVKFGKRTVKAKLNKKGRVTVRSAKLNSSGRVKIRVNYTGTKAFAKAAKKAQITVR